MGTTRSSSELDVRQKKALYRSWHRGTKEMDLLLGRFADAYIDTLSDEEMSIYETMLDIPDREFFAWLIGNKPVPANYDNVIFRRILAFHQENSDV